MDYKNIVKNIEEDETVVLYGKRGDVIVIEHSFDYIYTISLNGKSRDFLADEAAAWLDFYESKRGTLSFEKATVSISTSILK